MLFSSLTTGVRSKFIDVSRQAVQSAKIPVSVGFRSQALKLRFVTPESEGRFISPAVSLDTVVAGLERQFCGALPKPILHHAHVGESTSLLYAPFYVRERLYDAVLNSPVRSSGGDAFDPDRFETEAGVGSMQFVSTLCPQCGWDLEGARDSLVLHCRNCASAWYPVSHRLKSVKFAVLGEKGENTLYLPFWRIRAEVSGIELDSYADLIKIANLPRAEQPADRESPFRFWTPAFKVRPRVFMRLAQNMTLGRPPGELKPQLPAPPFHSVTLPVTEALESLKIVLASICRPRHQVADVLAAASVEPLSFTLVYVPFREGHHEYIQPVHQFAINKNLLALSSHL